MKKLLIGLLALGTISAFALEDKICGRVEKVSFFTASYKSIGAGTIAYPAMKVKFADNNIFYVHGYPDGSIRKSVLYKAKRNIVDFSVDFDSLERQEQAKLVLEQSSDQISCITFFNNIRVGKGASLDQAARTDIKL